jgi:hypothetical protein
MMAIYPAVTRVDVRGGLLKARKPANGAPAGSAALRSAEGRTNHQPAAPLRESRFTMPPKGERKRITLIVTATLDHNIELFSLATGQLKTEIVIDALSEYLKRHNVDPAQDRRGAVREMLQISAANGR